uniref:Uncharacterized protein n=1 Tax=Setaria digitata TaxID=48799 RepID=A0A915PQK3_9BILA
MEASTVGTVVLHEPSSAFDPDREMKDRKLAQIFKKLHMEQDLNTLLDFDDNVPRSSKVASNHLEKLNTEKMERCRPRKILDYAVLAKGQGYRNNLVGSFASSYSETGSSNKNTNGCRRIRFQKHRFDENISNFSVKRRSRTSRNASASKKSSRSRRFTFPSAANVAKKKRKSRSRSFACGTKGGILKRRVKDADNIKQAFLISKKILDTQTQHFKEFSLPEKWIRDSQKRKRMKKVKSKGEGVTNSGSIEDLAMERLVRAFKTAKLLYPEKFAEYFPDFINCFVGDENNEKRGDKNGVMSKRTHLKTVKNEEDAVTSDKNITSDSGDDLPKRIRKVPKILRDYSTSAEMERKKSASSFSKEKDLKEQKVSRVDAFSAGTSGLRKRSKSSVDSPSNQLMLSKSQQNGRLENTKEVRDLEETGRVPTSKRRRSARGIFHRISPVVKAISATAGVIQNNIEDSATESSSDESGNMRSSKRHRAQSGFYK